MANGERRSPGRGRDGGLSSAGPRERERPGRPDLAGLDGIADATLAGDSAPAADTPSQADARQPGRDDLGEPRVSHRRLAAGVAGVAVLALVAALLLFFRPSLIGVDRGLDAARDADPWWLLGAFVPSGLAFVCYAWLFLQVVRRSTPPAIGDRFTWPTSLVATLAGQAATKIVSAAGAGALAVLGWALRRAGLQARETGSRLMAFTVLLYAQYAAALILFGLGLWAGILPGANPPGLTLVPAGIGALLVVLVGLMMLLPRAVDRLLAWMASGTGRLARVGRKLLSVPATLGEGVRLSLRLLGEWRCAVRVVTASAGYWACNVAVLWMALQAVGEPASVFVVVQAFFVGMLANLLPLLPGGVGTVEGALTAALIGFGEPAGPALAAALTYRLIAFWLPTPLQVAAWGRLPVTVRRWSQLDGEQLALVAQAAAQRREDPRDC